MVTRTIPHTNRIRLVALALIAMGLSGCDSTGDSTTSVSRSDLQSQAKTLLLPDEPDGAVGILELREQLSEQAAGETEGDAQEAVAQSVVVLGKIGAAATAADRQQKEFPWDPGKAAFVMGDPAHTEDAHQHAEGEDHSDCPFCNKKAAGAQAVVQFVGSDGQPLPYDARQMFDLAGEELVVVTGKATLHTFGMLVIEAESLYVRR